MNTSSLLIITIILSVISLSLALYAGLTLRQVKRIRTLLADGTVVENLEEILAAVGNKLKKLEGRATLLEQDTANLQKDIRQTIYKVGIHRFNSLPDEGGNLSFTLALLNEENSGVVITSLYGRTQNRIYSKLVTQGVTSSQSTEEENMAISQASGSAHQTTKAK